MIFSDVGLPAYMKFPFIVLVTTAIWLLVTFLTPADDNETLVSFYNKTQPGGPGWNSVVKSNNIKVGKAEWIVPQGILCMFIGCVCISSALLSTGYFIYGEYNSAFLFLAVTIISSFLLFKYSKKIML